MSIDEDIQQIWLRQPTVPPPSEKELGQQAVTIRRRTRNKVLLAILILLCTIGFILGIAEHWHPRLLTTYIGIIFILLAIIMQVIASGSLLSFLFRPDRKDKESRQYLQVLIRLRERQKFLQTKILSLYFVIMGIGIFLTMIENTRQMNISGRILAYGATALWIVFCWFFLRPRSIRKEAARLNALIGQLEKVLDQFTQTP